MHTVKRRRLTTFTVLAVAGITALINNVGPASAAPATIAEFDSFTPALVTSLANPGAQPRGLENQKNCEDRTKTPVILLHGTTENSAANWAKMAPVLSRAGACVYAIDYGKVAGNPFGGIAPVKNNAEEVYRKITAISSGFETKKVDVIGHSQGGLLPRVIMKQHPEMRSVFRNVIGLASTNNGSTGSGVLSAIASIPAAKNALNATMPAFSDWTIGSSFLKWFNSGNYADTAPADVKFVNIATKFDEVVTPYPQAFMKPGPNVENIALQDRCPAAIVGHLDLPYDLTAINLVKTSLGLSKQADASKATCFPHFAPL